MELHCKGISEYEVQVQWNEPSNPNGVITAYSLSYQQVGKDFSTKSLHFFPNQKLSMIEKLIPFTTYNISIKAATSIGYGPVASCDVKTREGCK